jgi:lanosterol synthase
MVYLPMGYVYCKRFTPDVSSDPLLLALRKELYVQSYEGISWDNYRQTCAEIDEYSPLNPIMKVCEE